VSTNAAIAISAYTREAIGGGEPSDEGYLIALGDAVSTLQAQDASVSVSLSLCVNLSLCQYLCFCLSLRLSVPTWAVPMCHDPVTPFQESR